MKRAIHRLFQLFSGKTGSTWVPDTVYPDDIFIVSYPKSGNTWVRFLVGNYLTGNDCTFENCHRITPDLHMNPEYCSEIERPRFIKSHAPFEPDYSNVIYIVRDGRDVAVSYYHHSLRKGHIEPKVDFADFLELFNQGDVDGFGIWSEHVTSWLNQDEVPVLLVRYEDLLKDAEQELMRILEFAGVKIEIDRVKSAVEASKFENMRKQEEKNRKKTGEPGGKKDEKFMRKGKKNYECRFNEKQKHEFEKIHGKAKKLVENFAKK